MDSGLVTGSCSACHVGHGAPRSPMLPAPQHDVCLACHESESRKDRMVRRGVLASHADPPLLESVLFGPFVHPLTEGAFSRHEPNAVTCTSCHSPHRGASGVAASGRRGFGRRSSTWNPAQAEYEACSGCHDSKTTRGASLGVVDRLDPGNVSYHPVLAPVRGGSRSARPGLSGTEMNCSDCHGNSDPDGIPGPHGSGVRFLLRSEYVTADGSEESVETYALCYACHDRGAILDSTEFPEHRRHVVELKASCATCHDPHGSPVNRALIRFGDEARTPVVAGVAGSGSSGRLSFFSNGAGSGACYLTCHGYDHAPAVYGAMSPVPEDDLLLRRLTPEESRPSRAVPPTRRGRNR